MRNKAMLIISLLILIAAASFLGYRYYGDRQVDPAPPASAEQSRESPATPQPQAPKTYPVKVYFSKHPESDDDPSKVFDVARTSPDVGVGTFAITELLKGPTGAEETAGYFTTARLRSGDSTCGGQDFTLAIRDSVAALQFCRRFDHLGVVADGQADSTIKATLMQFPSVEKVIILNPEGNCEFDLSGLNLSKQNN